MTVLFKVARVLWERGGWRQEPTGLDAFSLLLLPPPHFTQCVLMTGT